RPRPRAARRSFPPGHGAASPPPPDRPAAWPPRRTLRPLRLEEGARAAREGIVGEAPPPRRPLPRSTQPATPRHPAALDACHQPPDGEHRVVHLREAGHRGMTAGAEATKEGALRLRLCPGRGIIEALEHLQHRAISTARLHAEDPLPHCGEKLVRGEDLD